MNEGKFERVQYTADMSKTLRPRKRLRLFGLGCTRQTPLPKAKCQVSVSAHLRVVISVERCMPSMLINSVKCKARPNVPSTAGQIPLVVQCGPTTMMRLKQQSSIAAMSHLSIKPRSTLATFVEISQMRQAPPPPEDREMLSPIG
jgi:hypothetical protein